MTEESAFDPAANLILDTMEEAFGVKPANGRAKTHRGLVSILQFYATPKGGDAVKETADLFRHQVNVERARCAKIACEYVDGSGSASDMVASEIAARIIEEQ